MSESTVPGEQEVLVATNVASNTTLVPAAGPVSTPATDASHETQSGTEQQAQTNNNDAQKNPFWKPKPPPMIGPDGKPLSKNAAKKLLKQQQFLERKPLFRANEKLKRKQKNKERHDAIEAGLIAPPPKRHKSDQIQTGITIGIDMSFDELMLEKEIKSMVDQIKRCYSYNRTCEKIVHLALTSFTGKSKDEFHKRANGNELWKNFTIHEKGLEEVWPSEEIPGKEHLEELKRRQIITSARSEAVKARALAALAAAKGSSSTTTADSTTSSSTATFSNEQQGESSSSTAHQAQQSTSENTASASDIKAMEQERLLKEEKLATIPAVKKVVYLSADSPNTITELEPGTCYVLGGIVDKNRYPHLCQSKAEKLGIETAQLPIGDYIQMSSRRILTVNQVFEILLQFIECNDWKEAFLKVIPQRKLEEKPRVRRSADAWKGDPALRAAPSTGSAGGSGSNSVASSVAGDDWSDHGSEGEDGQDETEENKEGSAA